MLLSVAKILHGVISSTVNVLRINARTYQPPVRGVRTRLHGSQLGTKYTFTASPTLSPTPTFPSAHPLFVLSRKVTLKNKTQIDYMTKNIYVIGAQCTGKTTLVNALEEHFKSNNVDRNMPQPTVIQEVARAVLKEKGFTREDITTSPSRALQLQRHILDAQLHAECSQNDKSTSN